MKRALANRILTSVMTAVVLVGVHVLPAGARRVGSEVARGGLTVAEQAARQRDLQAELMPLIPSGVWNNPVRVDITQKDREDLAAPAEPGRAPLLVGVVKSVPGDVRKATGQAFNRGVVEESPDGSFVWAVTVTSPAAQAIRVRFTDFSLPDNTAMYFLSADGQGDGPYVGAGRNGSGDFWTRSIASETGTIMLRYTGNTPDVDRPKISFVISDVGHIHGRPPRPQEQSLDTWPCSDNASCLVDASCVNTTLVVAAKHAVAKMEWIQGRYIYSCTGGLLVDTDAATQNPYFLTANHCLSKSSSNLETFFNYTTTSCGGTCPDSGTPPPASTVGATVMATGMAGDFTLLKLSEAPPAGAMFLGWNNNAPIAWTNGAQLYRISNPNFGPQVYSEHKVTTSSPTCTGWPRGQRIYSVDQVGATQGGSSGSPVLNGAGEVVGQLSGCCGYDCSNVCDSANNWTVDGALAYYWDKVSQYLDPQGGGGCSTNAECDDGLFCNGAETCVSGSCQSGSNPCPGQGCDEATDSCVPVSCGLNKAPCSSNSDCCSNNCKNGSCRGN